MTVSCGHKGSSTVKAQLAQRDTTVTPTNSYSELFFDSTALENFIHTDRLHDSLADRMRNFYSGRNYQYAWFFKEGIADYANAFLHVVDDYVGYSGDSALYNHVLHQFVDSIAEKEPANINDSDMLRTELLLTRHFFQFAHRVFQGRNQLNAEELEWYIPRKKIDVVALLDSVITNKGKNVSVPVNRQYGLLKNFLLRYDSIQKTGGWPVINADKKIYKTGDSSQAISQMKKWLLLSGDFISTDTTLVFNSALTGAVKSFQRRYGFKEDGTINSSMIKEMNRPSSERIRQMLINMERIRWVPAQPTTDYLLVNIPEFRLHAYDKGNYQWSMNIVVGSTANNTVIFTGTLKYIVFAPYWNVPLSILKKEILPAIRRNKNYLARHNMEWNGNGVRQKPGPNNSLGLVKFLFPNAYNIYLHDTPAKSLFGESRRAFSHGCIRLSEPAKLARFLLRDDAGWDSLKIAKAMNAGKEQYVTVKDVVPVYIGYFTAWVDREGKLNFRDDIYGHDKKMAGQLFGNKN